MSDRICLACHSPLTGDEADCPICGNPDYIVPDMTSDKRKKVQSWADAHREGLLAGIEVGVYTYSHEMKDGKLVQKDVITTKICDADALDFDRVFWLDEKFAQIDTDQSLQLTVVIKKSEQIIRQQEISFLPPAQKEFWQIGAQLTAGLGVKFLIGNAGTNVDTESIALI